MSEIATIQQFRQETLQSTGDYAFALAVTAPGTKEGSGGADHCESPALAGQAVQG